ncbi:quercetin 2,3-dioxygenase [Canicola haemoglobinophilus]|uniref:Pirin domain-containing protein n=1 Tax=Canicola haemoglobinophilus TaxID=733 RepID=A0A1V4B2P2_9PAST|nr:pirin family protein [Canicola haemoglobinophilus]OOS01542.1 quercetin 2,3-dioxygenase [Canicola haemoglobinophilus]STO54525.1 pirin domain-containing protein [Canicola haemoglobinophilus]STO60002.1 pirin domain-containing protein [Canicola haemoglobinophilus]STO67700.1 pirin domain-containing protein [Canicola haemoglobinophilus]
MLYIRKANERGHANHGWLDSNHTFSFASYYDPKFMGFSSLRVINEDRVKAGFGFGTHPHDNMEILSYVLEGTIAHKDSMGNVKELKAGEFQIMSAGTGVTHSEFNPSNTENLHFYQIWIQPNEFNIKPRYDQKAFEDKEGATLILSPTAENDSFKIYQDMKLWRYQLSAGNKTDIELDINRNYWLQVVKGNFSINGQSVETSDGIAISKETLASIEPSNDVEFLVFDLA